MRRMFFMGILIGGVIALIIYFAWILVRSLFNDWMLTKDVDKIMADSDARRQQKEEERAKRLDTGCEHEFGGALGGFPPNACRKCGMERERPPGPCDHIWKAAKEAVPCSYCQTCGKKYVSPHVSL